MTDVAKQFPLFKRFGEVSRLRGLEAANLLFRRIEISIALENLEVASAVNDLDQLKLIF
jgi:hypothetical protein